MADTVLSSSARGATFLILLQVLSRALTFIVNQVLLRFLSPSLLGISTHLELYSISVLFFARESIRAASQRQTSDTQVVVNLAYTAILSGVPFIYTLGALRLRAGRPDAPYFVESLYVYGVATFIELLSEPAFAAAQQKLLYGIRASAEGVATIGRCLMTCGVAIWASRRGWNAGVLPFAAGQMMFAVLLLAIYLLKIYSLKDASSFSLLPKKLPKALYPDTVLLAYIPRPLAQLTHTITLQYILKFFLTQGDSLISASLTSLHDQGTYALASNYGGLIARLLFQPIEESSRNLFAKLCAPAGPSQTTPETKPTETSTNPANTAGKTQAARTLSLLLHLYLLLSLLATTIGPPLSAPLLTLLLGARWSHTGASTVLATYCYYIPFLAINGILEAFVSAVATPSQLQMQSKFMMGCFAVFAGTLWILLGVWKWGAQGLVWGNCVNMGLRIAFGAIASIWG